MMPPFVVFPTNRIAHFVEVSLYLFYLAQQVNLANYISMVVSIAFVFNASVPKIHTERRKNLCKSIFIFIILALIIAGFCVLILNIDMPSVLNDIFTLIALLFCVCDKVLESLIIWFASLL